jgi:hypothetical protein
MTLDMTNPITPGDAGMNDIPEQTHSTAFDALLTHARIVEFAEEITRNLDCDGPWDDFIYDLAIALRRFAHKAVAQADYITRVMPALEPAPFTAAAAARALLADQPTMDRIGIMTEDILDAGASVQHSFAESLRDIAGGQS